MWIFILVCFYIHASVNTNVLQDSSSLLLLNTSYSIPNLFIQFTSLPSSGQFWLLPNYTFIQKDYMYNPPFTILVIPKVGYVTSRRNELDQIVYIDALGNPLDPILNFTYVFIGVYPSPPLRGTISVFAAPNPIQTNKDSIQIQMQSLPFLQTIFVSNPLVIENRNTLMLTFMVSTRPPIYLSTGLFEDDRIMFNVNEGQSCHESGCLGKIRGIAYPYDLNLFLANLQTAILYSNMTVYMNLTLGFTTTDEFNRVIPVTLFYPPIPLLPSKSIVIIVGPFVGVVLILVFLILILKRNYVNNFVTTFK